MNVRPTRIVVLDGYTLNPGDLDWDALEQLGECSIYDRTPSEQIVARAQDTPIVLTNKTVLSRSEIEQLPALKYLGVLATGYNVVDIEAARERDVPVTNVPDYGTDSVAQMTFAHLLHLTQQVAAHAQSVRDGKWSACDDFCFWDYSLVELSGQTMGIVGLGRIGLATARIAQAFGMRVIAYQHREMAPVPGIPFVALDQLFGESDVVSLHCPLTPETLGLVNAERLRQMKPSALLINTSRGPIVDQQALADALNSGVIAGAGLDVMEVEPPPADNPLVGTRNCYVTPHIGWATRASRTRLLQIAVDNVRAFLSGVPRHVVN